MAVDHSHYTLFFHITAEAGRGHPSFASRNAALWRGGHIDGMGRGEAGACPALFRRPTWGGGAGGRSGGRGDVLLRERLCVPVISQMEESLYPGRYFYLIDSHLSDEGAALFENLRPWVEEGQG